ncbi:MAG: hypothetical protein D6806_17585 [Deltaproteobacteria bacterium]|nr:MAG: hypothetical protein D6806_17585 [Deltaproteobacteria bacterium]
MLRFRYAALAVGLLVASPAAAQDAESMKQAAKAAMAQTGSMNGDVNFGMIDDDLFMTLNLGFSMDLGTIGFGVRVPLRLRLMDSDPQDEEYGSVLRREDWDEWTDYLKVIRYFRYGHKGDTFHLVVGELWGASLGHGTIVGNYYNNVDLDHFKVGLQIDIDTDYGGAETMMNNLFQPTLFGGRAYVRPWSFVDPDSYLNNFAVGFTTVSDVTAPYAVAAQSADGGYPEVTEEKATTIIGGDIEFRVLNLSWLNLTPYMDLNGIVGAGIGYHAGILSVFHLPASINLTARIEYRYMNPDYIPAYFDSYYEIQKFAYPYKDESTGTEQQAPKRAVLERLGDKNLNGYWAELVFKFADLFILGASYDDYDGPYNSNLRIYLDIPALEVIQFGAYYYRHNYEGAADAFKFDEKSLFLVEARYQFTSFLYVVAQYWRIWQLDNDPASGSYGSYVPVDDWSVGLGASYTF